MSNKRTVLLWMSLIFLSFSLTATWAFAKGNQKGQRSGAHSGWHKGEKKNWETDVSPGLEKKDPEWYEKVQQLKEEKQKNKDGDETNTEDANEMKERKRERKQIHQQSEEQEQQRKRNRYQKHKGGTEQFLVKPTFLRLLLLRIKESLYEVFTV